MKALDRLEMESKSLLSIVKMREKGRKYVFTQSRVKALAIRLEQIRKDLEREQIKDARIQ